MDKIAQELAAVARELVGRNVAASEPEWPSFELVSVSEDSIALRTIVTPEGDYLRGEDLDAIDTLDMQGEVEKEAERVFARLGDVLGKAGLSIFANSGRIRALRPREQGYPFLVSVKLKRVMDVGRLERAIKRML